MPRLGTALNAETQRRGDCTLRRTALLDADIIKFLKEYDVA